MAEPAGARSTSRKRTVAYSLGVAVLVLLVVAGMAFVNSISVARVTKNASSLHWTNATIGTSALTRAGLVQAVTFAELADTSVVHPSDLEFAMDQVTAARNELERLHEIGPGHDSHRELGRFLGAVSVAVETLERGEVEAAKEHIVTDLESAYAELAGALSVEQESIQRAIADNSADGRAINGWIVFLLTLAVPGSAVVVYFVVARRQMRALRERSQLELESERKVSRAKDYFIAGLSHELRTPLTSIYGFAEILTEGGITGREATEETARMISNEAAEMSRMVDDFLVASRLGSTGVEIESSRTDLGEVVSAAIKPFERAGQDVGWEPVSAFVETDAARLRHVLVNLISNAVRHGGPCRGIRVKPDQGMVDIEVWDDGPGVPEDQVDRMFERFVHDDKAPLLAGSVGLGLSVASRLTHLLGGELRHERSEGHTRFVVRLPVEAVVDDGSEEGAVEASTGPGLSA